MTDRRSVRGMAGAGENRAQSGPRGDAGFRKDPVQVVADGSVRQIEPGADLLVRKTFGSELRDVKLLRGQRLPHLLGSPAAGFARSTQFLARAIAPGRSAERIEYVASLAQRSPRVGGPALAAQPPAISQEKTSSQERPFLRGRPQDLAGRIARRLRALRAAPCHNSSIVSTHGTGVGAETRSISSITPLGLLRIAGKNGGLHEIREPEELKTGIESRIGRREKASQMLVGLPMPASADCGYTSCDLQHRQQETGADGQNQALPPAPHTLRIAPDCPAFLQAWLSRSSPRRSTEARRSLRQSGRIPRPPSSRLVQSPTSISAHA